MPFHAFFVKNASGTLTLKMIKDSQSILYLIVRNLSDKKEHKLHYMVGIYLLAEIKAQNV